MRGPAGRIERRTRALAGIDIFAPGRLVALLLAACLAGPLSAQDAPEGDPQPLRVDPGPRFVPESFAELSDRLSPAVVNITTTTAVPTVEEGMRPIIPEGSPFEDFFRDFMDRQPDQRRQRQSNALGSGFIISPDGYIVTNNHVIEGADEIERRALLGGELDAELIGRDPRTDIALLKVESDDDLPFVEFGDSDSAKVGDWVLAIGNPLGQGFSVSAGIVSARNRTLQGSYDDFIQTDAAINRGNSGGPLFDMNGRVIGVNTAILSPNGGSIGIGFAMSSAVVERVVAQLRDFGETRRGWLGVRIQNVDPDMADALNLPDAKGALVTDVPEGPALAAGMKAGDVVLEFGGEVIDDTRELVRIVAESEIGRTVEVVVFRDGQEQTLEVEVGLLEEATLAAAPGAPPGEAETPLRADGARHDGGGGRPQRARALRAARRRARAGDRRRRGRFGRLPQGHAAGRRHHRGRSGGGGDPRGDARPHRGGRAGRAQLDPDAGAPRRSAAVRGAQPLELSAARGGSTASTGHSPGAGSAAMPTISSSSGEMSSTTSATTWVTSPSRCSRPVTLRQRPEITARRKRSKVLAQTTTLAVPVSSSRVTKITPLAVPGRCRQTTSPATATRAPFGGITRSAATRQRGGRGQPERSLATSGCSGWPLLGKLGYARPR